MKRTNLVLDEELLEEAKRELGVKTYSAAVNYALKEVLRIRKVQGLADFFGKKLWRGNLSRMREDSKPRAARRHSRPVGAVRDLRADHTGSPAGPTPGQRD